MTTANDSERYCACGRMFVAFTLHTHTYIYYVGTGIKRQ